MLLEIQVKRNDANQRVDRYVRKLCPGLGLSRLHYLFRKKEIKIGLRPVARSHVLEQGDRLRIFGLKDSEMGTAIHSGRPSHDKLAFGLPIIHEDEDLLVINKPGHIPVHPGSRVPPGSSVIEKSLDYLGWRKAEVFKPSLIHRLDKETSGVLLLAKNSRALRFWAKELKERRIKKTYHALVLGAPRSDKGCITENLTRIGSKRGGAKSIVKSGEGLYARTFYQVDKRFEDYSLLSITIETGRLHQIRAHLSHEGAPILGDTRYGDFRANRIARRKYALKRGFLHAASLQGKDMQGKSFFFRAELPDDLRECLARIS
ncbi:RluA family pseudouridine synthase [Fibrobacterota bacterium]